MRPAAYRGFASQGTNEALRYLACLVLLVSIPTFLYIYIDMSAGVQKLAEQIKTGWPDFKLAQGQLRVYSVMPMVINNGDGSLTVIDTTGRAYSTILHDYPTASYIITRDQIFQRRTGQARVVDFKMTRQITFTKQTLVYCLDHFTWLGVLMIIFGFPFLYLFKILEAAAAAVVALLVGMAARARLNYEQAFRISLYALTVPFIVQGAQKALWPGCPYPGLVFYSVLFIYLVIGVIGATRSRILL